MSNRRTFLTQASVLGAATFLPHVPPAVASHTEASGYEKVPAVGETFNESSWVEDSLAARKMLRLTSKRQYNQLPANYLFNGFSEDSKYLTFASYNEGADSALILADLTNGDCRVLDRLDNAKDGYFSGKNVAMLAAADRVAVTMGRVLWVYDLNTSAKTELHKLDPGFVFGTPAGLADGVSLVVPVQKAVGTGGKLEPGFELLKFDAKLGDKRSIYKDDAARCSQIIGNPRNPDLVLIHRDLAPKFELGSDQGRTARVCILNLKNKALTEVKPLDSNRFQLNSNWSFDGRHVFYNGLSGFGRQEGTIVGRKHYVGFAAQSGTPVKEWLFPSYQPGSLGSSTRETAIITDGLFLPDTITQIKVEAQDYQGSPTITLLARHESDRHDGDVHNLMSPDGKYLAFSRGTKPRADIYLLQLQ